MSRLPPRSRGLARRSALIAAIVCLGTGLAGCASRAREDVLQIEAGRYAAAFDAALSVASANGIPAVLRDRRAGIIETEADFAPSLLEPWRLDGATVTTRLGNTLALQRRRARFEFTPAAFQPVDLEDKPLAGPDLLALDGRADDLTRLDEPLELRVRVYLERAHEPGLRHDTWSRRMTTRTKIFPGGEELESLDKTFWTPVARDRDFERRLLAAIEKALAQQANRQR